MLFLAAKENKQSLAESLLKLNKIKTIDFVNTEGKTPLIEAVQNKSYDVVDVFKTLLEKDLEIVTANSIEDVPFGYFVIGYELARQAGLGEGNLTTDTGYRIENV